MVHESCDIHFRSEIMIESEDAGDVRLRSIHDVVVSRIFGVSGVDFSESL